MNFSDIVGQSVLVDRLKRITQSQRIGHAYLFVGPEGIGKKTVSDIFVRGLLCKLYVGCYANHKVIGLVICVVHASSLIRGITQIYIELQGKTGKV